MFKQKCLCLLLILNFLNINFAIAKTKLTPQQVITESIIIFNTQMDLGVGHEKGLKDMMKVLIDNKINTSQLSTYVLGNKELTDIQKQNYSNLLNESYGYFDKMDPKELGILMGETIDIFNPQGLSWSGCASLGVGITTLVAAIVVGIVAITKSAGSSRLEARYERRRGKRTDEYEDRLEWLEDPINSINNDINYTTNEIRRLRREIDQAYRDLQYWNLRIISDDDPSFALSQVNSLNLQISQDRNTVRIYSTTIQSLLSERDKHNNDPTYVVTLRANATSSFNIDISALNIELETQLDLIPKSQALSRKLGIGSTLGLAVGGYFLYDGIKGNCRR
jgi:hypothetical protein